VQDQGLCTGVPPASGCAFTTSRQLRKICRRYCPHRPRRVVAWWRHSVRQASPTAWDLCSSVWIFYYGLHFVLQGSRSAARRASVGICRLSSVSLRT